MHPPVQLQRIALNFVFGDYDWRGFDRLEVWRARLSSEGPYEALHGDSWAPATLPLSLAGSTPDDTGAKAPVGGLDLQFLVMDKYPISVVIPSTGYVTIASAAAAVNTAGGGHLRSYPVLNQLLVQTTRVGAIATLTCTGGQGAPSLGLPTSGFEATAYGQDARIILVKGQPQYSFADPYGSPDFFYKTRFYNSATQEVSDYGLPIQGATAPLFDNGNLVACWLKLVDGSGNPMANQEVLISTSDTQGLSIGPNNVVGTNTKLLTTKGGMIQILLTRGLKVVVAIGGTALAREVRIPNDPSVQALNLLDPAYGRDDLFSVQTAPLDFAVRRTL